MVDPGLLDILKKRALEVGEMTLQAGEKTLNELAGSEERADEAIDLAVRSVRGGRRVLDEQSARVMNAMGVVTQTDFDRLARKVTLLERRMERLVSLAVD